MITSTFVLKDKNSKNETTILLLVRYNYKRIKYSTGEKIKPAYWEKYYNASKDGKKLFIEGINDKKLKEQFNDINIQLLRYSDKVNTINNYFKVQKITPTFDFIKQELDKEFVTNSQPQSKQVTLFSFIDDFIESTNKRASTLQAYKNTLNHLKEFQTHQKKKITFENIDLDFYDDFIKYLKGKDFSENTIGKLIKNVKVFMSNSEDKGLHNNRFYKNRRFKVMSEDSDSIYLSVDELDKIYTHDFSKNSKLDKIRDLFIIACWTGLRFSDMCELSIDNISTTNYGKLITIKTVKTGETVVIPVHQTIIEILKKYDNALPKVPSNQKMNDYLKDIGEAVKIKETVEVVKTKGGLRYKEAFKKWELITTHTARRSFATNMYMADMPSISIMKITGHKTEKSFLRYIKISPEDNAKKMLQHPLFRQSNLKVAN